MAFTAVFTADPAQQVQWQAFIQRHRLAHEPPTLLEAIQVAAAFLQPVTQALLAGHPFDQHWPPGGPWREGDRPPPPV